jgi:transcriptional regulator with XRE-family HTH domain
MRVDPGLIGERIRERRRALGLSQRDLKPAGHLLCVHQPHRVRSAAAVAEGASETGAEA